jgi:RNAse (barnase) inhibitor barstar
MNANRLAGQLADPAQAGVFHLPLTRAADIAAAARANRFRAARIDLADCDDKEAVLAAMATALEFPDWFGHNWDALADCLTDFSWSESPGYVLVFSGAGNFSGSAPDDFDTLVEVLSQASASWSELQVPFWAFILEPPAANDD